MKASSSHSPDAQGQRRYEFRIPTSASSEGLAMAPTVPPAVILQIKEMALRGGRTKDIARHLGLSISTIHKIRQGYYDDRLRRPVPQADDETPAMIAVWCPRCRCHVYPPCQVCRLRQHERRRPRVVPLRQPAPLPAALGNPQVLTKLTLSVAEIGLPL